MYPQWLKKKKNEQTNRKFKQDSQSIKSFNLQRATYSSLPQNNTFVLKRGGF